MAKTRIELLLEEIAKKYDKPYYVIWEIYMSQFKKVREEMGTLNYETIKLPAWGKFIPSQSKIEKFNKRINKYDNARGETKNTENNSI